MFDQEYPFRVAIGAENFAATAKDFLIFKLNSFILPETESGQKSKNLQMELAKGAFQLQKLFEAPDYQATFYVSLLSKIPQSGRPK